MGVKIFKNPALVAVLAIILLAILMQFAAFNSQIKSIPRFLNAMELLLAVSLSILMLLQIRHSFLKYVTLGSALALICWTGGELFALSFHHISGNEIEFPSIADFGYIGFYLMLSCSLGIFRRVDSADVNKGFFPYLIFLLMLIPGILYFQTDHCGLANAGIFIYGLLNAVIMYQALILIRLKMYPYIIASVLFIGIVGMLFLIVLNVAPEYLHHATLLFPIGFAGLVWGMIKHNGDTA